MEDQITPRQRFGPHSGLYLIRAHGILDALMRGLRHSQEPPIRQARFACPSLRTLVCHPAVEAQEPLKRNLTLRRRTNSVLVMSGGNRSYSTE